MASAIDFSRLVLGIILAITSAVAQQTPPPPVFDTRLELGDKTGPIGYDPVSGSLAIAIAGFPKIDLYAKEFLGGDATKKDPRSLDPGHVPGHLLCKHYNGQSYLLSVSNTDPTLEIFDLETLERLARIRCRGPVHQLAAAQDADQTFVYYIYKSASTAYANTANRLGRINLETLADEDLSDTKLFAQSSGAGSLIVSPDGRRLTAAVSNRFALLSLADPSAAPEKIESKQWISEFTTPSPSGSNRRLVPDPKSLFVGFGTELVSADLAHRFQVKLRGIDLLAFHPKRPIAFSLVRETGRTGTPPSESISVQSTQHYGELQSWRLPAPTRVRNGGRTQLFADPVRGRIIVVHRGQILACPDSLLDRNQEPLIGVRLAGSNFAAAGRPYEATLEPLTRGTNIELVGAPAGLKLEGGKHLSWLPGGSDVGRHHFHAKLRLGNAVFLQPLALEVQRQRIDLPFIADQIAPESGGMRAFVWRNADGAEPARGAVIDFDKMAVVASREFQHPIADATFDSGHIAISYRSQGMLELLSAADLSLTRRTPTALPPSKLHTIAPGLICIEPALLFFSLPDLVETQGGWRATVTRSSSRRISSTADKLIGLDGGRWALGPLVFSPEFDKLLLDQRFRNLPGKTQGFKPWQRSISIDGIYANPLPIFTQYSDLYGSREAQLILREVPIAAFATTRVRDQMAGIDVVFRDLISGAPLEQVILDTSPINRVGNPKAKAGLASSGRDLLIVRSGHAYRIEPGADAIAMAKAPLRFVPNQSDLLLPKVGTVKLAHAVDGGAAPYSFALDGQLEEATIDPASGELTLDCEQLYARAVLHQTGVDIIHRTSTRPPPKSPGLPRNLSVECVAAGKQIVQMETGQAAKGDVLPISVAIKCTDASSTTTQLSYVVWMEIAKGEAEKVQAAIVDEARKANTAKSKLISEQRNLRNIIAKLSREITAAGVELWQLEEEFVAELKNVDRADDLKRNPDLAPAKLQATIAKASRVPEQQIATLGATLTAIEAQIDRVNTQVESVISETRKN